MNHVHPKTFWGYPIDQSQILVSTIHLAPDRDVKANEFYKIAESGYAFALRAVRAGERGDFAIAGEFFIFPDDPTPPFKAGEIAGCNLTCGCLVKKDAPNSLPFYEIEEVFNAKDGGCSMLTAYFSQPDHP